MTTTTREGSSLPEDTTPPADEAVAPAAMPEAPHAEEPADRRALRAGQAVALLVALGLLAWAVAAYVAARSDRGDADSASRARDALQVEATHDIEVLNTLDARHIDTGLAAWASVSAGELHDQLGAISAKKRAALSEVAQISSAKVVAMAVTRMDDDGGTAAVIAFVEKSVGATTQQVQRAAPTRIQFSADLVREAGSWRVSGLTPIAVVTPEGKVAS